MDLGFTNATAVVVGGGRGMGLAAARCIAEDGARIAVVARSRADLEAAVDDLSGRGSPEALGLVADASDADAMTGVFDTLDERWGELNVLVNAVGPSVQGTVETLTDDDWHRAVDDGVLGMVHCVRSALPLLRRAEWARIVNFSASSTQRQSTILPAYTAAKAMVTSVSKNLSLLLAPDEILVNVVSPGSVASEALVGWAGSVGVDGSDPYRLMDAITSTSGIPRICRVPGCPGDRARRRVPGVAAQLLHDRGERQRRRRIRLHLTAASRPQTGMEAHGHGRQARDRGRPGRCAVSATRSTRRSAVATATTSTGTPTARWCATASATSDIRCSGAPAGSPSSGR